MSVSSQYSNVAAAQAFAEFAAHAGGEKALIWSQARRHFVSAPTPPRVLDFGCGSGWLARQAADEFGARAWGYDPSAEMIAQARSGGGATFTDVLKEAVKAGPYDLIFAVFVTPAIDSRPALNKALKQMRGMLADSGRLVLVAANPEALFAKHAFFSCRRPVKLSAGARYETDILKADGSVLLTVTDHYWPVDVVVRAANKVGLRAVSDCRFCDSVDGPPKNFAYRMLEFAAA